jgi:HEAT repeat protein
MALASQPDHLGAGKPVEYWIERAQHSNPIERSRALFELARLGPRVNGVIPALIGALADEDFQVRCGAVRALGDFGQEAVEAVNQPRQPRAAGRA